MNLKLDLISLMLSCKKSFNSIIKMINKYKTKKSIHDLHIVRHSLSISKNLKFLYIMTILKCKEKKKISLGLTQNTTRFPLLFGITIYCMVLSFSVYILSLYENHS